MPCWGKLRIAQCGDSIWTLSTVQKLSKSSFRDNTFVRYELPYISESGQHVDVVCYGQLNYILECHLDNNIRYGDLCNSTLLLALIIPCATNGLDASSQCVEYKRSLVPIITDLRNIKAAVGRVGTRRHWGIIDCSSDHIQITFAELELGADARVNDADDASTSDYD
ncbi:uncharacterized protein F5147DRAFT_780448 [Suillus discolor]|uniref:Uncharacterized protein n=1 Tax=Suillus discolor TaxID=1912936 RepID=A0A9P7EV41_9AGAM|nr:uncharacterized protein F5147DRAFT_780448 [Suillus discolor]KAG2090000.1 hypothetical protein F5147DRAFT_780448 [Suillus discolor]